MDKKLEEYRAKRKREEFINNTKDKIKGLLPFKDNKKNDQYENENLLDNDEENQTIDNCDAQSDISEDDTLNCCTTKDFIYYLLCFILWLAIYAVFIELQFGIIYFIVSALLAMYFNTRTGRKRRGEVSAYSVFNKNCESIDGTLKAEQLERQMIYGRLT